MPSALTPEVLKLALILGFLLIVALTRIIGGMIVGSRLRRAALQVIQSAVEKGERLDPAVIEQIISPPRPARPASAKLGPMPGIMTIALGIGVSLLAATVNWGQPDKILHTLGSGLILICLGVGLLICDRVLKSRGES